MNWEYFLMFWFILTMVSLAIGTIQGALHLEREKDHYTTGYGAFCAIVLVVLILMWFWT